MQALPEAAGGGAEAPLTPARWEDGKKSMVRKRNVPDDVPRRAQAAPMVNILNGG